MVPRGISPVETAAAAPILFFGVSVSCLAPAVERHAVLGAMSLKMWSVRRDRNEAEIVQALRAVGASVTRLSERGCPDLLCGYKGDITLLEVKEPGKSLTQAQLDWFWQWEGDGPVVVTTVDQALQAIGAVKHESQVRRHVRVRYTRPTHA